jgi:phenylalanyl-tRNA synthetase beta chain
MKINLDWLQDYIVEPLPGPDIIQESLTMHSFEVEGMENSGSSIVLDIDVLPNRAQDSLSHRGVAREVAAVLQLTFKEIPYVEDLSRADKSSLLINIVKENSCNRFSGCVIKNIQIKDSPDWIQQRLKSVGQRPINNVVDVTNYVMLSLGQPMHAYDYNKLDSKSGLVSLKVRESLPGEIIRTVDDNSYTLPKNTLLIVDGNKEKDNILGIAGVKGGSLAEIDNKTSAVVLESANFDAISVRTASKSLDIRSEASKRFENGVSIDLTTEALAMAVRLLTDESNNGISAEKITDHYPNIRKPITLNIKTSEINNLLGSDIKDAEIESIYKRLNFNFRYTRPGMFDVDIPADRLDLRIKEDLIEEVGRIYGYDKIEAIPLKAPEVKPGQDKNLYYAEIIRDALVDLGYFEIYTYSFADVGEVEVLNAMAQDKKYLRSSLSYGVRKSLELNERNAELLGLEIIKLFEIGKVFKEEKEVLALSIGVNDTTGKILEKTISDLSATLGTDVVQHFIKNKNDSKETVEIDLDRLAGSLDDPTYTVNYKIPADSIRYKEYSTYPIVLRDIAVFVPESVSEIEVLEKIHEKAGNLLVRSRLFDIYKKKDESGDSLISYAFRLVFQSNERTLTDEDVNFFIQKVTKYLNSTPGWKVR